LNRANSDLSGGAIRPCRSPITAPVLPTERVTASLTLQPTTLNDACPRAQPVRLLAPAAAGAALLALQLVVSVDADLHDRLTQRLVLAGRQPATRL
jgi:hypothetical protein